MVRVISKKINPYGLVVNGEQMGVNYDDLVSNEIMVSDEKYSKNFPIMPNKSNTSNYSKLNNNGNVVSGEL